MNGTQERKKYPTDLTNNPWEEIKTLYKRMRTYKWSKHERTRSSDSKAAVPYGAIAPQTYNYRRNFLSDNTPKIPTSGGPWDNSPRKIR